MLKIKNTYLLFIYFICCVIGLKINYLFLYCSMLLILINGMICKNNDFIYTIFFLIPNIRIYDVLGFKNFINIIIMLLSFGYMLKNNCFYFKKKVVLMLIVSIIIIETVHLFFYQTNYLVIFEITTLFPFLFNLYFFCMFLYQNKKFSLHKMSTYLILGVLNSSIIKFIDEPSITLSFYIESKSRFIAFSGDPNYYSLYILLGVSYLMFYCYNKTLKLLILPLIFFGLLSSSKMFMLCLIFICSIYMLHNYKKKVFFLKIIPIIILLSLIIFLIFGDVLYLLIDKVIIRFGFSQSEITLRDITSDRSAIIMNYLAILVKSPFLSLIGGGLSYNNLFSMLVAHNTFFDILLSFGIIGYFYILFVVLRYRELFKGRYSFFYYQYLIIFGIILISLSALTADMFFYLLFLTLLPLIQGDEING